MNKENLLKTKKFIKKHWKLILTIIYLLSPIDLIPDVLLPLGYTDDLILIITAVLDYYVQNKRRDPIDFDKKSDVVDGEIVD